MQELNTQFLITHGTKTTFNSAHDAVSPHIKYKHHTSPQSYTAMISNTFSFTDQKNKL